MALLVAACTATYPVVGKFSDHNEVFLGTVNADLMTGQGFIEAKGKNSGVKCRGLSRVVYIPPSNYAAGIFMIPYCAGQKGIAALRCDDGRQLDADWTATSCTSGFGSGDDNRGARFDFAFGMSEQEATAKFGQYQTEVTSKPDLPVYKPRTFLSPGYQDNLGWGFATALGAQDARRDVPVLSINGDGGFMYTANELATAVRHRIPLVAVVFADGNFGNVRRIQQEDYGNRVIASDLANPDFVKFAESFGAAAERVRTPDALRGALRRGFARRDGPTLIEMPVGPMPSPWDFILMGKVRGA